ncbi:MAG: DUF6580 family putative transport protein [Planctomycetota bacterium]
MKSHLQLPLLLIAAVTAVLLRFAPLPVQNFSGMGALAVLSGTCVRSPWMAVSLPLAARLLSDVILHLQTGYGFYSSMPFDYAAYALIVLTGRFLQPQGLLRQAGVGLVSAATFFFYSNLGVWCLPFNGEYLYPRTLPGLLDCYVQALPFARGTLISDLLLTPVFLGTASLLLSARPQTAAVVPELLE